MEIYFYKLDINIWLISAVLGTLHLTLYPGSVVRNPPVHAVVSSVGTAWSEADVPNQDVLGCLLVCERTTRVSLTAVLAWSAGAERHIAVPEGDQVAVISPLVRGPEGEISVKVKVVRSGLY